MSTWILILALWGGFSTPSLLSIPGFLSEEECLTAGTQIKAVLGQSLQFICPKQTHPTPPAASPP